MNKTTFQMIHTSSHSFDFPDMEKLIQNRTGHPNGGLGFWVSKDNGMMGSLEHCYDVDIFAVTRDLPISTLVAWSNKRFDFDEDKQVSFYKDIRQSMLSEGVDYLRLVEVDGKSHMGIVLNLEAITSFSVRSPKRCPRP